MTGEVFLSQYDALVALTRPDLAGDIEHEEKNAAE